MSKLSHFTTVTPLPDGITRETVIQTLHNHVEMIDLNPLVVERHPIKPPREASPEEINCIWYSVTDKIQYIPGLYQGKLTFNACFHDLPDGMQSHIYAPMGLDMRGRWYVGGNLPGEPRQNVEMGKGIPKTGLYLREDVDMRCNFAMTAFVRKTTKKTHNTLVERLIEKSHVKEGDAYNHALSEQMDLRNSYPPDYHSSQEGQSTAMNMGAAPAGTAVLPVDQKPGLYQQLTSSSTSSHQQVPHQQKHPNHRQTHDHQPNRHHLHHLHSHPHLHSQQQQAQTAHGFPPDLKAGGTGGHLPGMSAAPPPSTGSPQPPAQGFTQSPPPPLAHQGSFGLPHLQTQPIHPAGGGVSEMPASTAGQYGAGAPEGPNKLGTNFSVELPNELSKTPIEIGSSAGGPPPPRQ